MRKAWLAGFVLAAAVGSLAPAPSRAQEPVVAAADVDALFTDRDPKLHANKQVAYHIMKDLLEAGNWQNADRYLTERYIQHNPNVPSGRAGVVKFFADLGVKPKPVAEKLSAPVVRVLAQGDYVVIVTVSTLPTPSDPSKTYTTSWFDMFRFKDGKADEHWDSAPLMR